ncbi:MAG: YihY family inner membrane protein [Alphaproteobacteria bacterium]
MTETTEAQDDREDAPRRWWAGFLRGLRNLGVLSWYVTNRFLDDGGPSSAASLAFTSLLALVPLTVMGLSIVAAFPVFEDVQIQIQQFALENFVPEFGDEVASYITSFSENAGSVTALGVLGLAVTSVLIVVNIESAFNRIWRAREFRAISTRILTGWSVITLGPLLLGASLSLSSDLVKGAVSKTVEAGFFESALTYVLPAALSIAGFTLLNKVVPNTTVRWWHAAIAGAFTSAVFALLRATFTSYLTNVALYQTLYGTLWIIPLTLLWAYFAWTAILVGACLAASLADWHVAVGKTDMVESNPTRLLRGATSVLAALSEAARKGRPMKRHRLVRRAQLLSGDAEPVLQRLRDAAYVTRTGRDKWVLCRDLSETSLFDLMTDMKLRIEPDDSHVLRRWVGLVGPTLQQADGALGQILSRDLKSLLQADMKPEPADAVTETGQVTRLRPR